jgi:hypothetical protein
VTLGPSTAGTLYIWVTSAGGTTVR